MTLSRQFPPAAITLAVGYFAPIFAPMIKYIKIGIVILGYILAFVSALAAVFLQMLFTDATQGQASSGMAAFGDAILFLLVFGTLALVPTALAFFFLRPFTTFWNWFAAACVIFSLATPAVAIANTLMNAIGGYGDSVFGLALSLFGILGVFAAPVFLVGFLVLALMTPTSRARGGLLLSAGLQASAGLYTFANLVFFQRFF